MNAPAPYLESKPVFVCGMAPRTGSTAVQRIINAHPEAYIWGEPGGIMGNWWAMYVSYLTSVGLPNDHVSDTPGSMLEGKPHLAWSCAHLPGIEAFLDGLESAFRTTFERGNRIWGFKDIRHFTGLPLVKYALPNARFIFVTRDPVEIVRSAFVLYETWERSAERYEQSWKMAMVMLQRYRESCLVIDQGELQRDPDKIVRQLYRFIDEPIPIEAYEGAGTITGYIDEKEKRDPPLETRAVYEEMVRPMHDVICGYCDEDDPGVDGVAHAPGVVEVLNDVKQKPKGWGRGKPEEWIPAEKDKEEAKA